MSPAQRMASAWLLVMAGTLGFTACGSDPEVQAVLGISEAWARPTPAGATNGVIYLAFTTDVDDAIVDVSVSSGVAREATLHETQGDGGEGGSHHEDGGEGELTMVEIEDIELEAGKPFVFEPGGNHIMLEGLAAPLARGDEFALEIELASGRTVSTTVIVSDNPPDA
jgi:periplasmic copper chaperone A